MNDLAVDLSHFALLAHDLDVTLAEVSQVLGLTFTTPAIAHAVFEEVGVGEVTTHVRVAYSRNEPPYCEVLQPMTDLPLFGSTEFGSLHHIGGYVDGLDTLLPHLIDEGRVATVARTLDGEIVAAYSPPAQVPFGTRVEYLPRSRQAFIEAWIRSDQR